MVYYDNEAFTVAVVALANPTRRGIGDRLANAHELRLILSAAPTAVFLAAVPKHRGAMGMLGNLEPYLA